MSNCDAIRERLAEDGVEAAGQDDVASHLKDCADCAAFLESLRRVETALGDLPMPDAPEAVAARTLRAVRRAAGNDGASAAPGDRDRWLAAGLAASVLIATGLGLGTGLEWPVHRAEVAVLAPNSEIQDGLFGFFADGELRAARGPVSESEPPASARGDGGRWKPDAGTSVAELPADAETGAGAYRQRRDAGGIAGGQPVTRLAEESKREMDVIAMLDATGSHRQSGRRRELERMESGTDSSDLPEPDGQPLAGAKGKDAVEPKQESESYRYGALRKNEAGPRDQSAQAPGKTSEDQFAANAREGERAMPQLQSESALRYAPGRPSEPVGGGFDDAAPFSQEKSISLAPAGDGRLAAQFLERHRALDGLSFQEAAGYWANTYIPGDPAMRLLGAQLRGWNRAAFPSRTELEQQVRPNRQPFDAPHDAALAVYLHADVPTIDGPTRLRVQVGLKGAERQGGHRPAMNVGLVVDLREGADARAGARIRALISALNRARQPEDRFSLTVAGPGGGMVTPPEFFRHGPLYVAMGQMFAAGHESRRPAVGLQQAIAIAAESVRRGDDPGAVLGSSLIILVTGSSLADDLEALETMAHRNAVTGLPLSVIGLAAGEDPMHVERLVTAGQGNRRVLDSAQAADLLIDRELHAASRAVARAVRLRIRLAPGVRLVDVLGSHRLAAPQAERVREAEQSIDQRLARNLGIQADRGEDEEGLQMVIPTFHAGNDHVILLDVVADKAGPIADVTARYKDVIHLKNGVAQASLTLARGSAAAGPLELNVLKNLVAREFALRSNDAARALAAGNAQGAAAILAALRDLIHSLRGTVAGWRNDADLAADETLLNEYLAALAAPAVADATQRRYVAASLRYAAFRKLQSVAR